METVDEDILDNTVKFIDRAKQDGKPFFIWINPSRVHVFSHLSPKYQAKMTPRQRVVSGRRPSWRSSTMSWAACWPS